MVRGMKPNRYRSVTCAKSVRIGLAVCCGILLLCLTAALAAPGVKTTAHYRVSSRGFSIGDVTTTQSLSDEAGVPTIHFETRTAVKASFLWMGYQLETVEKGTLRKGELVSYTRKGQDNGTPVNIDGRLSHGNFVFVIHEKNADRTVSIPRSSYEYTTMECPEAHITFTDNTPVTLSILDVEKLAVVKREYRLVRTDQYSVDGREYPCRVVDYADPNKKARRWINWDGSAVVMYRQDSKGEKNSFTVKATSVLKGS